MATMVPKGLGTDKKSGEAFEYGGFPVQLSTCDVCEGVYADLEQHAQTAWHKRHLL